MTKPIVWTIAGSDSGGGAGIQADLHTFQAFGVHGCSVITALTAQNSTSVDGIMPASQDIIAAQLQALKEDLPAKVIKIGMLVNKETIAVVVEFLEQYPCCVILDPVMVSSSGDDLFEQSAKTFFIEKLLPYATLLTPNLKEAEVLTGIAIHTQDDVESAAKCLLSLGAQSVLIKGGHFVGKYSEDYFLPQRAKGIFYGDSDKIIDQPERFWLSTPSIDTSHNHGSGCSLSSAIAALLAQGHPIEEALVIAKMYVTRGIRQSKGLGAGPGPVMHGAWPLAFEDLPLVTKKNMAREENLEFPQLEKPIGFYPIVNRAQWVERLLPLGVTTIQLRIKDLQGDKLKNEIQKSIALAEQYGAQLFINDYWQQAIELGAYGVHLGQEDINTADLSAIAHAGLRLGLSTHSYYEVARAHAVEPSYLACGPIYETTSKDMVFAPQGIQQLKRWRATLSYPLVAIGGINLQRLPEIMACQVDGVAVISAITEAQHPEQAAMDFMRAFRV